MTSSSPFLAMLSQRCYLADVASMRIQASSHAEPLYATYDCGLKSLVTLVAISLATTLVPADTRLTHPSSKERRALRTSMDHGD